MFNLNRFPKDSNSYPVSSYSGKKTCLDQYLKDFDSFDKSNDNPYVKMFDIMPDILKLYDSIETKMPDFYKADADGIKKYGSIVGVAMAKNGKKFKSKFMENPMDYATPYGFIYPILGSFRALIKEDNGKYVWVADPFKVLDKIGPTLVNRTIDMSRSLGNNPNATGKSTNLWELLYTKMVLEAAKYN